MIDEPDDVDEPRSWSIDLLYKLPPLTLNTRMHHMAAYRRRREIRDRVRLLVRQHRIPRLDKIDVQLHYLPATNATRDEDNLVGTLKPAIDGLRDYPATRTSPAYCGGVVVDDDPEHVTWSRPIIHPARRDATTRLWLVITEVRE